MKKYIIGVLILSVTFSINAQVKDPDQQKAITQFTMMVSSHDVNGLKDMVIYPLNREYPVPDLESEYDFEKRYDDIFDDNLVEMIVQSNPAEDWSQVGDQGLMLYDGVVWLDFNGQLMAINYTSKDESVKVQEFVELQKSQINESVRDFKKPIILMDLAKFKVRVDQLNDGSYRYTSWSQGKDTSEAPDIIIYDGTFVPEGTGGNYSYEFESGLYKYICYVNVLRAKGDVQGMLTIYNGDKILMNEPAIKLQY